MNLKCLLNLDFQEKIRTLAQSNENQHAKYSTRTRRVWMVEHIIVEQSERTSKMAFRFIKLAT